MPVLTDIAGQSGDERCKDINSMDVIGIKSIGGVGG